MHDTSWIEERLRRVASRDDDSDWDDVIRRAGLETESPPQRRRVPSEQGFHRRLTRRWVGVLSGAGLAIAGSILAVAVLFGATASTPPAYAVTTHPDGSMTIVLRQLATGIPGLNARLRQLHVNETVLPITTDCHSRGSFVVRPSRYVEVNGAYKVTFKEGYFPADPGFYWYMAARRLSNGKLLVLMGAAQKPKPTCLRYDPKPVGPGFP